ncbi:FimV/HubP family polar landmark protein [Methylolobus aquaticus]
MHSFSKALVIVGLLAPGSGQTLGVGEIKLHSFLNQPLDAEVPLVLSGEQLDQIRIGLAAPAEFAKVGLTRSPAIGKLRFDAVQRRDGSFAVRIRSLDVISEPFLSFLMEVTWPQGRMLRSFTVLLDPPDALAAPVVTARRELTAESGGDWQETRPVSGVSADAAAQRMAPRPTGQIYGPVARNENLWKIAERLKPDASIPTERMMTALFRLNPQAFSRPSVNALNAGTYLRVPGQDDLFGSGDPVQSRQSTEESPFQPERRNRSAQHRVAALATSPDEASGAAQPNLNGRESVTAGASSQVRTPDNPAWPAIEKLRRENEQLRNRMTQLELRVTDLTRQLEARDRSASAPAPAAPAPAIVPAAASGPVVEAASTTTSASGTPASRDVEAASQPVDATGPATVAVPAPAATPTPAQVPAADGARHVTEPEGAGTESKPANIPIPSHRPSAPLSARQMQATADDGLQPWLMGLAAALVAALVGGYARRRIESRRSRQMVDDENALAVTASKSTARSAPAGLINAGVTEPPAIAANARPDTTTVQTAPEFARNEPLEGDALFEAEIYLSYGKFRQAEESIRRAIELAPEHPEPYLKLLQVYAATQDRDAFRLLTEKLKTEHPIADPEFWARADALAEKIGLPLGTLEQTLSDSEDDSTPANAAPDETDQLIAKLKHFSLESRILDEEIPSATLDDASQGKGTVPPLSSTTDGTAGQLQSAASPEEAPTESTTGTGEQAEDAHVIPYTPIPFSKESAHETVESALDTDAARSIEDLLKELSAMHFEEHLAAAPDGMSPAVTNRSLAAQTNDGSHPAATEVEDLESKLDLARAYADMQDVVQARIILNAVITAGTAEQRREAQALLTRLG